MPYIIFGCGRDELSFHLGPQRLLLTVIYSLNYDTERSARTGTEISRGGRQGVGRRPPAPRVIRVRAHIHMRYLAAVQLGSVHATSPPPSPRPRLVTWQQLLHGADPLRLHLPVAHHRQQARRQQARPITRPEHAAPLLSSARPPASGGVTRKPAARRDCSPSVGCSVWT